MTERRCAHPPCTMHPASGEKWCYYHAKVNAGLLEPVVRLAYDKRFLERVEKRTLAALLAELETGT